MGSRVGRGQDTYRRCLRPPARCDVPLVAKRVWETSGSPYGRSVQRLGRLPGVAFYSVPPVDPPSDPPYAPPAEVTVSIHDLGICHYK